VGAELIARWKLPATIQDAVRYHHRPGRAARCARDSAIVHVADIVANALGFGSSGEVFVPPLIEDALERVGLSGGPGESLLDETLRQYEAALHAMLGE
jgi:hypothetical protein